MLPETAPAVVTFRNQRVNGTTFRALVPRREQAEKLEVEAPGFQTQTLLVTMVEDRQLQVTLKPALAPAGTGMRRGSARRTRRRTRRRHRRRSGGEDSTFNPFGG